MITHEIIQQMERELKSNLEQLMLAKHETRNERIVALFHSYTRKLIESLAEEILDIQLPRLPEDITDRRYSMGVVQGFNATQEKARLKVKEILSNLK